MRTKEVVWLVLVALAAFLTILLKYFPYLPGDVGATRLIQSLLPESRRWAELVSSSAEMPWVLGLIAGAFVFSWAIAGWRAGLLSLASFLGLWLAAKWLGPAIAQPRPSPELVQAPGQLPGFAFPSIFAFNYMATAGFLAVLAALKASGNLRWIIIVICVSLLVMGGIARVDLAAHWPSDVAISYLIGLVWVALLIRFV